MAGHVQVDVVKGLSRLLALVLVVGGVGLSAKTYLDFPVGPDDRVPWQFHAPGRVVAIGDLHADPVGLYSIFHHEHLIDELGDWAGGDATVVLVGDFLDRGPDSRSCLDWLAQWAEQARAKGGEVHRLVGNHETMAVTGDLRYLASNDARHYRDFAPSGPVSLGYLAAMTRDASPYARELGRRNVIEVINGTLFVHGGVGDFLVDAPPDHIGRINSTLRNAIRELQSYVSSRELPESKRRPIPEPNWMIRDYDGEGPLWIRSLAEGTYPASHLQTILRQQKLERVVIGHTQTRSHAIEESYGGKVIHIDTAISQVYPWSELSALEISADGRVSHHDGIPRMRAVPSVWRRGNPALKGYYP